LPQVKMEEVLLLTATGFEQEILRESMAAPIRQMVAGRCWTTGALAERGVRLVETGIGAVNAAHALTCALQATRPGLVVQLGVGGAYPGSGLRVGDLALASEENYGDLGVRTARGWEGGEIIGLAVLEKEQKYFNCFPLDQAWVSKAEVTLEKAAWDKGRARIKVGPFVTVQECSGTAALGAERQARFKAVCENMEGAAAAHLCRLYGVPFLELRGISNLVEERQRETWDLPLASRRAQEAVPLLLRELMAEGELPECRGQCSP
jgi:futalosine hydrolase